MNSVGIVNHNLDLSAAVTIQDGSLHVEYFDQTIKTKLDLTLNTLQNQKLTTIKELHDKDGGIFVVQKTCAITDPGYLHLLAQELESLGFRTVLINTPFVEKIKENREEWNKALDQKISEILKNKGPQS